MRGQGKSTQRVTYNPSSLPALRWAKGTSGFVGQTSSDAPTALEVSWHLAGAHSCCHGWVYVRADTCIRARQTPRPLGRQAGTREGAHACPVFRPSSGVSGRRLSGTHLGRTGRGLLDRAAGSCRYTRLMQLRVRSRSQAMARCGGRGSGCGGQGQPGFPARPHTWGPARGARGRYLQWSVLGGRCKAGHLGWLPLAGGGPSGRGSPGSARSLGSSCHGCGVGPGGAHGAK